MSNYEDVLRAAIEKCWEDEDFRNRLLEDPKSALSELGAKNFPVDFKIVVHETRADEYHLVLPPPPTVSLPTLDELVENLMSAGPWVKCKLPCAGDNSW